MRRIVEQALEDPQSEQKGGIALLDIIQLNGLAKSTSALKIREGDKEGMIFLQEGRVAHAMFGNSTGEKAFFEILETKGAEIQNIDGIQPPLVSIGKNVESMLLEAAVRMDEEQGSSITGEAAAIFTEDEEVTFSSAETVVGKRQEIEDPEPTIEETVEEDDSSQVLETEGEEDMTEIQKILAEFTNIDGVHTACLVGRDGFLLDSLARTGIDAEMIGAIASSGFGSAEAMGNQLGQGKLNMTMLEYAEGPVMFSPVGEEAFLVIVADKDTNLGWIRIAIKKNSARIEKVAAI